MSGSELDLPTLRRFVEGAGERLSGEWLVMGGVVIPLLGGRYRVTADIDLAGPEGATQEDVVVLMELARDLGLPVETINPSGAFFLRRIPGWREQCTELHRGSRATILVPNGTLYLLTKIDRLSPADLDDCLAMLRLIRARGETLDGPRVGAALDAALAASPREPRARRLATLRAAID